MLLSSGGKSIESNERGDEGQGLEIGAVTAKLEMINRVGALPSASLDRLFRKQLLPFSKLYSQMKNPVTARRTPPIQKHNVSKKTLRARSSLVTLRIQQYQRPVSPL